MQDMIKILAVADPAIYAFGDKDLAIFDGFKAKVAFEAYPWNDYAKLLDKALHHESDFDIVMIPGHLFLKDLVKDNLIAKIKRPLDVYYKSLYFDLNIEGNFYALPAFYDGHLVVFRKGVSEALDKKDGGVLTPDEFCYIAKNDFEHKFSLKAAASEIFTDALPFLRWIDNGKIFDVYDDNGKIRDLALFEDRLKQYCELKDHAIEGTENFGNEEVAQAFIEGKTDLMITWSGQMGLIDQKLPLNNQEFGFATLNTAWSAVWSFALLEKSSHKELCQDLFDYLQNPDIDLKCAKFSGTPLFAQNKFDKPWLKAQERMLSCFKPLPLIDNGPQKNGNLYAQIHKAYLKEESAQSALNNAYNEILKLEA